MKNLIRSIAMPCMALVMWSCTNEAQAQMRWGVEAGINAVAGPDTDKTHVGLT